MLSSSERKSYIANVPIGAINEERQLRDDSVQGLDINTLPNGLVTGSNLVQFPTAASGALKSSVALSLLLAQRVAATDTAIVTPQQWIDRHNVVLTNLNWMSEGGGLVDSTFKNINVAVHQAIIPFLTAAFGGAIAAGALIITALKQLAEMDKTSPWITLFDRQSRRFNVTEYMFTVVDIQADVVKLNMASARLDARFGTTQVLFFQGNDPGRRLPIRQRQILRPIGVADGNERRPANEARCTDALVHRQPTGRHTQRSAGELKSLN